MSVDFAAYVDLAAGDSSDSSPEEESEVLAVEEHNFAAGAYSAKYIFLTFAKCYLFDEIFEFINRKAPILRCVGSFELHEANAEAIDDVFAPTGEWPHSHWAIEFKTKKKISNPTYFDVEGFHPNIQKIITWGKVVNYCRQQCKDGKQQLELFYHGCDVNDAHLSKKSKRSAVEPIDNLYDHARALASNPEAYFNSVRLAREIPRYAELAWNAVQDASRVATAHDHERPATDPRILQRLSPYLSRLRFDHDLPFTLVVLGPSGCGKSFWAAKQLNTDDRTNPCLRVGKKEKLKLWNDKKYKSIFFDECSPVLETYPNGTPKWTIQDMIGAVETKGGLDIEMRYRPLLDTPSCPRIWTCTNVWPFPKDYQIARRCRFINLYYDDPETRWLRTNPEDQDAWTLDEEGFMIELPDV